MAGAPLLPPERLRRTESLAAAAFGAALAARPPRRGAAAAAGAPPAVVIRLPVAVARSVPARASDARLARRSRGLGPVVAGVVLVGWGVTGTVTAAAGAPRLGPTAVAGGLVTAAGGDAATPAVLPAPGSRGDRSDPATASPTAVPTAPPSGSAVSSRLRAAVPVRVRAAGIDAPLVELGLDPTGALDVPRRYDDAGWWRDGPRPGERGAAVLVGHVDSRRGPAVFHPLLRARVGDRVTVRRADGTSVSFVVYRVAAYAKQAFPTATVYGPTDGPELRLITCSGAFDAASGHYRDNLVIFARSAAPAG